MNTNETYALGGAYLKAKKTAFNFCKAEKRYKQCVTWINGEIDTMQENPSVYQGTIAILAVLAAIGLGYLEAHLGSQGLAALGASETASIFFSWVICCSGLLAGEKLGKGIKNRQINEFTGKYRLNGDIVGGGILTIAYVFAQFFISYSAASESGTSYFFVVCIMLISLFELLVGAIFLKKSIMIIGILLTRIKKRFLLNKMSRIAAKVERLWQLYLYNISKSALPVTQAEEVPAIQRARDFHNSGGFMDDKTTDNN